MLRGGKRPLIDAVCVASTGVIARVAAPLSLLAVSRNDHAAALQGALVVATFAILEGWTAGRAVERAEKRCSQEWVHAMEQRPVSDLTQRPADESAALLIQAMLVTARNQALTIPKMWGDGVTLAAILITASVVVGVTWVLMGAALILPLTALLYLGHRRLLGHQQQAWKCTPGIFRDAEVLLDGSAELRGESRERPVTARFLRQAGLKATHERRATTLSVMFSLLPLGIAVGAFTFPSMPSGGTVDAAVLGAAAVAFGLGLSRKAEGFVRTLPQRLLYARFTAAPPGGPSPKHASPLSVIPHESAVVFDRVSVRYPGAPCRTPAEFSMEWAPGRGLALMGPNGCGKSTLSLVLMGLLEPTEGAIWGRGAGARGGSAAGGSVVFVPQRPLMIPTESVRWHLEGFGTRSLDPEVLEQALRKMGLWDRLLARGVSPLEVPAGQLSGGERQRMQLARILLPSENGGPPSLILLDEPEAGLDENARALIADVVEEMSKLTRVLLIAHDDSVVPKSFGRAHCVRDDATEPKPSAGTQWGTWPPATVGHQEVESVHPA